MSLIKKIQIFSFFILATFATILTTNNAIAAYNDASCWAEGGSCYEYSPGDECPNGGKWDTSIQCGESQGDRRCCVPLKAPKLNNTTTCGSDRSGSCVTSSKSCPTGTSTIGTDSCSSGYRCCASTNTTQDVYKGDSYYDSYTDDEDSDYDDDSTYNGSANNKYSTNSDDDSFTYGDGAFGAAIENVSDFGLPDKSATSVAKNLLEWLLIIFIILSFISFVVTGLMYLFAGVNKGAADKAKDGMKYSILALVVAFSAYIIITLVSDLLNGTY